MHTGRTIGLVVAVLGLSAQAKADEPKPFTVKVEGVKSADGLVGCLLFTGEPGFPNADEKAVDRAITKAEQGSVTCTFASRPKGRFAVSVRHDANSNMKLDENFFGAPTEGYGFTRDAKAHAFGPPDFAEAALEPAAADAQQTVHLVYP